MIPTAVVRAECPTCGAPLDFDDAARAIRCTHCRSQLLVTGRRQVLSYVIPQRTTESDARSLVRFSLPADQQGAHVSPSVLHLVPYYRITAEQITWRHSDVDAQAQRRRNIREVASWLGDSERRGIWGISKPSALVRDDLDEDDDGLQFTSRVIERNFVGRDTVVVPHSLGVRASVLELQLFDREKLPPGSVVVSPDLPARVARERALDSREEDGVHARALLRLVVQIVYFPFWMVPLSGGVEDHVVVVDAVTGAVVCENADRAAVEALAAGTSHRTRTLGFRPLACPNCGWDLPFRPDDLLFQCSSCERGWLAQGERLEAVSFAVADAGGVPVDRYLPVWRLGGDSDVAPIFAPAFRCRRLKALLEVGSRLTRRSPEIEPAERIPSDLVGCALDEEDARTLARFVAAGIAEEASRGASRPALPTHIDSAPAELLWLPFTSDGYALREPTTGTPVPSRLLDLGA